MLKDLKYSRLLDFYAPMLTEKQREILSFYYNDDLSLSEISEIIGISRQGVMDIIRRGEAQLNNFDSKLNLSSIYNEVDKAYKVLNDEKCDLTDRVATASDIISKIRV